MLARLARVYPTGASAAFVNEVDGRPYVMSTDRASQAAGEDDSPLGFRPTGAIGGGRVTGLDSGPLVSHGASLLDALYNRVPLGIAVFDKNLALRSANRTWSEYVAKYTPTPIGRVIPGARLLDLIPGDRESLLPSLLRALTGESIRHDGRRSESGGVVSFWDSTVAPLIQDGQVIGVVEVKADATERLVALQQLERRVAEHTRALSALHDVITAASGSLDLTTVLSRSIERVVEVIGSEAGAIHLLSEEDQILRLAASKGVSDEVRAHIEAVLVARGLAGTALASAEPLVVPRLGASTRPLLALPAEETQAYVGVPIRSKGQPLGVLSVVRDGGLPFSPGDISLLTSIAGEVGVSVENAQLYRQAEQLAIVRERERLARELHDSVTQSLYSLTLLSEAGHRWAERGELARVEENLQRLSDIGQQALKEMRLLVYELRPLVLRREGLVGAIQHRLEAIEKRAGVDAWLEADGFLEIAPPVEEALYWIAQEALNNALKHARAASVHVHVLGGEGPTVLRITDDGVGFDPLASLDRGGMGLLSMRERTDKMGGELTITSSPGGGTIVEVRVPAHSAGLPLDPHVRGDAQ